MRHLLRLAIILVLPGGFIVALYYFLKNAEKKFGRRWRLLRRFFRNTVENFLRL